MVKILYLICSPLCMVLMYFKGVKIAFPLYCSGWIALIKKKNAYVYIGRETRFSSYRLGNRIGLNHKCILTIEKSAKLYIGQNCGFSGVSIWCFQSIHIGNNVRVGANVLIMDGDAHQNDPRSGKNSNIIIEDNVWIGADVRILKGVTIGKNSMIGIGSIVTKSIPANVIAAGNPCRVIRPLADDVITQLEKTQ
ncbi:acyltransferase [Bacteroides sp.]